MRNGLARPAATIALMLAFGVFAVACGESGDATQTGTGDATQATDVGDTADATFPARPDKVTLTVGARKTPEEAILGQIYAQALKGAGYKVKTDMRLAPEAESASRALENDRISGYPEHLTTLFPWSLGRELEDMPTDPQEAYQEAKASLEKEGVTVFPPAPYSFAKAVGALRMTADKLDLKTVSDLKGKSEDLLIVGTTGCHGSVDCVGGLEFLYKLLFEGYFSQYSKATEPFRALESKLADLGMVSSTDGRLAAEKDKFVILEDDKERFPPGNPIFVTETRIAEEAGPKFEKTIVAAQKGLTLPVMQGLNAKVEIEKKEPAAVAAEYLKQAGLG